MIKEAFPLALSSLISVSIPAENISTITPISATSWINEVSVNNPNPAGPKISPASNAPTTCGIWTLFVRRPSTFVDNKIIAKSSKYL